MTHGLHGPVLEDASAHCLEGGGAKHRPPTRKKAKPPAARHPSLPPLRIRASFLPCLGQSCHEILFVATSNWKRVKGAINNAAAGLRTDTTMAAAVQAVT